MMMLRVMLYMMSCGPVLHDDNGCDATTSIGVPCHRHKYGITEGCLSRPAITLIGAPVEPPQPAVDQSARPLGHPAQPAVRKSLCIQRRLSCVQGNGAWSKVADL